MSGRPADVAVFSLALAAGAYAVFALLLLRDRAAGRPDRATRSVFVAAVCASALWAAVGLVDWASDFLVSTHIAWGMDLLRYGLWFGFLVLLLRPGLLTPPLRAPGALASVAAAAWGVAAAAWARAWALGLAPDAGVHWMLLAWLALPVVGVVLVEQIFRNLPADSRWNAKPVCVGLACIFTFDVYLFSEATLFGRLDPDALNIRGAVHALAVPLLFIASRRHGNWIGKLQVSRKAAFYSASLVLVGSYLLFIAGLGYVVRAFGGDWGRALQLALLSAALVLLPVLMLSGSMRSRLRVFVGKHFFSYRYDYREEWLRFTSMLSSKTASQDVGGLVVRGLADMLECPAGSLWTLSAPRGGFAQSARWNLPDESAIEPADSAFCDFLRMQGWIIDLDEYRNTPKRYGQVALPSWLLSTPTLWLVVPLLVHDELLGFVVLARPRVPMEVNWEARDLLKTASRQAAGFLAQMHATEALLEARKFDAFNRMSAFVVHDLKNIVTQLSLMLKNAERLHDNREFQQDMLLTVQSSLEKMRRLMLQLREGATPPGAAAGVELWPIFMRLQAGAKARGRTLELADGVRLATRGHEERLERVLGHLVDNALDATPATGRVWLKLERHGGQVKVTVGDTGIGMTEEFVQSRLFRPFNSTKESGMGIGTHESLQYIRELGGHIDVKSQPGQGTIMSIVLPLFVTQPESDLAAARP